ncbi:NADPH-dependent glutamate synthase [Aliiruegeria sabulilitoris]|uniref:NADPH-dependent glutamate synthase n=1 Tax=Aliiruegeria sabulilitoris TaxID=1510458 RepID=UPI000834050A|nr:NADPH-dependent glutamate synthase [Aliiruegeria sabulilitoris]NDR59711.1 NADPH-dependent glutamate synthase [Pseudoruegeria sp. M32A2M]
MARKTIRSIPQERAFMPVLDAKNRATNFEEVSLGFDEQNALVECERCLICPEPACIPGCPVEIDIPGFISKMLKKDYHGAWDTLTDSTFLPAVCGRVCPQEDQCEGVCAVAVSGGLEPVAIGRLERWLGDMAIEKGWKNESHIEPNDYRIGIVGSGPASMACAADLAKAGCKVTVFEALHAPGGVLRYGIPEFRLPNSVVDAEIGNLEKLGVEIRCNTLVGRLFTVEQMLDEMGYDAVFIGTGAGYPSFMDIPGENFNGVLSANELLTRCNLMQAGKFPNFDTPLEIGRKIAVIGAGNTAMDAMRVSKRLGAEEVTCVYRRTEAECPARLEELHHAMEEGINFQWLTAPVEILGDSNKNVRAIRCQRMELGEPDDSGRRRPVPIPGSEFEFEADTVVYAIGTAPNPILGQTSDIKLNKWGYIDTDETLATSLAGVYAGGDIVTGAATVILAMGAGRRAAASIRDYLGIRDSMVVYEPENMGFENTLFGIDAAEKNFVHVRQI